jgi:hypothetical protein
MNPITNRPCSESTEVALRAAMSTLHAVIAEAVGQGAPAKDQYELTAKLAASTLNGCDRYKRDQALNSLKSAVLVIAKDAVSAKRAEKEAFEVTLSECPVAFREIVRKATPSFDHVVIPLASFASAFPQGTDVATMRSGLQSIGCKLQGPTDNMGVRLAVV